MTALKLKKDALGQQQKWREFLVNLNSLALRNQKIARLTATINGGDVPPSHCLPMGQIDSFSGHPKLSEAK
ncbi:hypothetical protein [Glutamicibacter sp. JC586]|uniref:hypothetical protein n=1 Tax=Glutamicibacter sp. JC586 TaxID=2590552 RepID=UPI001356FA90|nr:hypothetical protein [Glutamicibacter sp. JC586]